jgi:hypothetical protein
LVKREPQNLAIRNPTLIPFITKLVRTLDGISFNNNDKCVTYFNIIANPQTSLPKRIKFRRRAKDKILYKLYQIVRGATSELKNLWNIIIFIRVFRKLGWTEKIFI